ncbi:hypothetical protein COLO4_37549 [Corchorus olitorius]|uniref:Uncharacterized protein n=1 Tax=Corchorus olitorius TaxID=93759 RepID=A0A1R3G0V4_9ROSI|nr:hypothetical protein COLO4_37549 [Corchorus olitorius]
MSQSGSSDRMVDDVVVTEGSQIGEGCLADGHVPGGNNVDMEEHSVGNNDGGESINDPEEVPSDEESDNDSEGRWR